ncbi:MAG: sodium:calcium antiporter, partial [Pseudomonadota bacterium]
IAVGISASRGRNKDSGEALLEAEELQAKPYPVPMSLLFLIGGVVGLALGAHYLVEGAVVVAHNLHVPTEIIGLTLVAIGTSLPELSTALMAALRNECDVAVGNVVGSNMFNILAIVGVASQFGDIEVPKTFLTFDLWVMLGSSLILLPFALVKGGIGRKLGMVFLAAYGGYIYLLAQGAGGMSDTMLRAQVEAVAVPSVR